MKKFVFAVLVMFLLSGVSFGEKWTGQDTFSPIIHDGSKMEYYPDIDGNYPATHFVDVFNTDSNNDDFYIYKGVYSNSICIQKNNFLGHGYARALTVYEDDTLKKLIPYLSLFRSVNSNYWEMVYDWCNEWGYSIDETYYKDGVETTIDIVEAYKLGIINNERLNYNLIGKLHAYAWLEDESVLTDTFGFTKAPIEMYFSPEELEEDEDASISSYELMNDNPNLVWALFCDINLKDTITEINNDHMNKYGRYRIQVVYYVPSQPVYTFIN
ncbi:MAG: hypothetical protein ABUK08_00125 [Candidatus Humimicrobiaceae bacterium]